MATRPSPRGLPRARALAAVIAVCALTSAAHARAGDRSREEPNAFFRIHTTAIDAVVLGAGCALTLAAARVEDPDRTRERLHGYPDGAADFGDFFGSVWGVSTVVAGLAGVGAGAGLPQLTDAAIDVGKSAAGAMAVVGVLKVTVNRERPDGGDHAFPSGHTTAAFSMAGALHTHFGWKVGVPALAAATLTGVARLESNRHYLSDVVAGATIGILAGRILSTRGRRLPVTIALSDDGVALALTFQHL